MEFLTTKQASELWKISRRRIAKLCDEKRIDGAVKMGGVWLLPKHSKKPEDARIKTGKYIRNEENKNVWRKT